VALLLAAAGVYASLAHAVARRRRELGIRKALGADTVSLVNWAVARGMTPPVAGVATGVVGALAVSRLLGGLLYGIEPTDPFTLAAVACALLGVSFAATLIPARRATGADPVEALRAE
jgi:ABC-type lipoprotein release transport system permease subunit